MDLELVLGIWVCAFSSFWIWFLPLLLLLPPPLRFLGGTIVVLGWGIGDKNPKWNFWCFRNYYHTGCE